MIVLALFSLLVAVASSLWTAAYALQESLADLLWLQRERQWDAWWDTIESMHVQLDVVLALDDQGKSNVVALTA
jgi:hypothetical protein